MWLSGRKRLTANEVGKQFSHGFESHRLRNDLQESLNDFRVNYHWERGWYEKAGARRREAGSCKFSTENYAWPNPIVSIKNKNHLSGFCLLKIHHNYLRSIKQSIYNKWNTKATSRIKICIIYNIFTINKFPIFYFY